MLARHRRGQNHPPLPIQPSQPLRRSRRLWRRNRPRLRFVLKQAETSFQQASRTDSLPRVGGNQSPALFARSKYSLRMNYPLNGQNFCKRSNPRSQMVPSTRPSLQSGVKCATANPPCGGPSHSKSWCGIIRHPFKIRWLVLCPQNGNEMAQFILDLPRCHYRVGDLFAQELTVTLPHPIGRLRDGARSHS